MKGESAVQCRLAAKRQHDRVDLFLDDDPFHKLRRHRHQIDPIRKLRAGLDGGDIGVDQNGLDPLFLERLDRLGPGVVKLTCLADLKGSRSQDQDSLWFLG